ncbi:MAG: hypothetical protein HZB57_03810 [Gammaproteobacteria bacterium]|nr:hypothetical protein [Gammaproteobacteria bacterium]
MFTSITQALSAQPVVPHNPPPDSLDICFQHSCARHAKITLGPVIRAKLASTFAAPALDAEVERAAIARTIAVLEQYVGRLTGTDRDLGGTFPGAFQPGQMDCIDEASNTTHYLRLFEQLGWLHWHEVLEPATRLPIPRSWWPHTTAVIRERDTHSEFAVDSWFDANGHPPHIVDLKRWRHGWKPQESSQ